MRRKKPYVVQKKREINSYQECLRLEDATIWPVAPQDSRQLGDVVYRSWHGVVLFGSLSVYSVGISCLS